MRKEKLAQRAGYKCSKPGCGRPTRGADSSDEGTINLGEAAHITAASPGGPRYDPTITPDQRKALSNGIWLCGTDAKLVDSDESYFTVEELRSWKRAAEIRSFNDLVSLGPSAGSGAASGVGDSGLPADLLINLAKADLATFQRMPGWPPHAIALNLKMVNEKGSHAFAVSGLAAALDTFDQISVIAPPGTGKTTTLLQLAASTLEAASLVAVFVPLGEWSTRSDTFIQALSRRVAFRDVDARSFELLAQHGKLALLLDGWNELDEPSRKRARAELKALQRDFPSIHLVISSRDQEFDLPISGPVVEVGVLTEDQQLEIARAMRGEEGEILMEHAWRTSGLRELVGVPLYLSVLLKHAPGGKLPTTKEEVLRTFVTEHEQDPDKAATLRQELQDFHPNILRALASEAMRQKTTTLSDAQARGVVNRVQERLRADHQITLPLQPLRVLDVLVSIHMLVRSGAGAGVSFQHQQFQEWYASFSVEELMRSALSGDSGARRTLREDVLDVPFWEESILFACDRLSRADDDGARAVSDAILETLGIDPLLSAEMIYRSSDAVWALVKDKVMSFVERWHTDGRVDRAVQFMINTGRAEFAPHVWPLISNPDSQVHLRALRAGRRFRTTVLGSEVEQRVSGLSDELRAHVLSEIARESGMEGIELATRLAKSDASAQVKIAVIESLQFRRGDRWTTEILQTAPDEVWRAIAQKWNANEFADPNVSARIEKEAQGLLSAQTDPRRIIGMLLNPRSRGPEMGKQIGQLLREIDFSDKKQDNSSLVHEAYELYPDEVAQALVVQLENGRRVPFRSEEWLRTSSIQIDEGPLVQRIMQSPANDNNAAAAVSVVGSKVIGELIDQYAQVHTRLRATRGTYDKALSDENSRLSHLIEKSRLSSFITAVLERSATDDPEKIALLADLISGHGRDVKRGLLALDIPTREKIATVVGKWGETLLASPNATRAQMAEIAQAAERLASSALVPVLAKLLDQDLVRWKKAKDEFLEARRKGIDNDAQMSWTLQYRRAFAAIGDTQTVEIMKTYLPHREFGVDAAHVLRAIWERSQPPEDERTFLRRSPDFSIARQQYGKRQEGAPIETVQFVEDILAVVDSLIGRGSDADSQKHALRLAAVAFSMPHAGKDAVVASLLKLPLPTIEKQRLLTFLVLSGRIVPSAIVLQGIEELLEQSKANPWMLQEQNGWRLDEWLALLTFTDNVGAVLTVLDRLEPQHKLSRNLHGLLSALTFRHPDLGLLPFPVAGA